MAGTKRHIDQVLKSKLGNHLAQVDESDWAAFEQLLDAPKKPSRRAFYFRMAAAFVVFLALLGGITYYITDDTDRGQMTETPKTETKEVQQEEVKSAPEQGGNQDILPSVPDQPEELSSAGEPSSTPEEIAAAPKQITPEVPVLEANPNGQSPAQTPEQSEPEIIRYPNRNVKIISPRVLLIPTPSRGWFEHAYLAPYPSKEEKNQDSALTSARKKMRSFLPPLGPSVAVGVVYGFGTPELSLKQGDPTQIHEDYNSTLKGANKSSRSMRFQAQYEYRLKFGLLLSAGLQMTSSVQVQQFSFENRKIPFLGLDDEIVTYFVIPNSQSVTPTTFESRQTIYSASIPMNVGYAYRFGNRFSMGVRLQAGIGTNWSKAYQGLNPKTLTEETISSSVNPLNLSYGGGFFGEYMYLQKWSVRGSFDWTRQNKQYINSANYNLMNRFMEVKLSLVRYL